MHMKYYLAPMEGLTTYIFRNAYHHHFHDVDKYFTPFIGNRHPNRREIDEILPEHNEGITVVPQILSNRVDEFLAIARRIESYGYDTVNLNLGCPSGTVTAKKRGAGFLSIPDQLDIFLEQIYEQCPLKISVKTRIGIASEDEWAHILDIYKKYPMEEVIIHPRLQKQQYEGVPYISAYKLAEDVLNVPLVYNGNITSVSTFSHMREELPNADTVMLGRGLLEKPGAARHIQENEKNTLHAGEYYPDYTVLRAFHDELYIRYQERMSGEMPVIFKMKELWGYMIASFPDSDKYLKKIRKVKHFSEYENLIDQLFQSYR